MTDDKVLEAAVVEVLRAVLQPLDDRITALERAGARSAAYERARATARRRVKDFIQTQIAQNEERVRASLSKQGFSAKEIADAVEAAREFNRQELGDLDGYVDRLLAQVEAQIAGGMTTHGKP